MVKTKNVATFKPSLLLYNPPYIWKATTIAIDKKDFKDKSIEHYARVSVMMGYIQLQ